MDFADGVAVIDLDPAMRLLEGGLARRPRRSLDRLAPPLPPEMADPSAPTKRVRGARP
jgi:hypothetical protein